MAERYRQLPSQILHLDDPYTAWCVDEAITMFKTRVDISVEAAGERAPKSDNNRMADGRRQQTLERLISYDPNKKQGTPAPQTSTFADPAARMRART